MFPWGGNKAVHTGECPSVEVDALFCSSKTSYSSQSGGPQSGSFTLWVFHMKSSSKVIICAVSGFAWRICLKSIQNQMHAKTTSLLPHSREIERLTVNAFGFLALCRNRRNRNKPVSLPPFPSLLSFLSHFFFLANDMFVEWVNVWELFLFLLMKDKEQGDCQRSENFPSPKF